MTLSNLYKLLLYPYSRVCRVVIFLTGNTKTLCGTPMSRIDGMRTILFLIYICQQYHLRHWNWFYKTVSHFNCGCLDIWGHKIMWAILWLFYIPHIESVIRLGRYHGNSSVWEGEVNHPHCFLEEIYRNTFSFAVADSTVNFLGLATIKYPLKIDSVDSKVILLNSVALF